jgi:hypothetical protein
LLEADSTHEINPEVSGALPLNTFYASNKMSIDYEHEIFISHIAEESAIALELKRQLLVLFGNDLRVFCSSDKQSIQGGQEWFRSINEALVRSQVVIALLSDTSRTRPWILYEIGVAKGAGAVVLLLTVRNLDASKLSFPISGFQVWSIHDLASISARITSTLKMKSSMPPLSSYNDAILKAENTVTYKHVILEPVIVQPRNPNGDQLLMMHLRNVGNTDIDLISIEIYCPEMLLSSGAARAHYPNQLVWDHCVINNVDYKRVRYLCGAGSSVEALVATITPSMGEIRPAYPRLVLRPNIEGGLKRLPLFYQVHARNYTSHRESTILERLRIVTEFDWDDTFPIE